MTAARIQLVFFDIDIGAFKLSVLINQFVASTFCFCFSFTGINFRGMLHHVCDVAYDENMCGPIRTRKYWRAN